MPKSKVRKKTVYTPPPGEGRSRTPVKVAGPTHPVYIAVMLGLDAPGAGVARGQLHRRARTSRG